MSKVKVTKGKITFCDPKTGEIKEINIPEGQVIQFWKEEKPDTSHRGRLNRDKDGLVHPQIAKDLVRIRDGVSYTNEEGYLIGKYELFMLTLSPKPKTLQRKGGKGQTKQRNSYKDYLKREFEKSKGSLQRFKGKKIFVYLCFYLRKEKYEKTDLDNYPKLILDALKPFSGDDSQITTLLLDKKLLYGDYHKEDLDFIENTLIVVAEEKAKQDLLKAI